MAELRPIENVRAAIRAQERHNDALMRTPGVVGTAVSQLPNGRGVIQVFVMDATPRNIPDALDSIPVHVRVTGMLVARSDPKLRLRPAPLGYSVGHPAITAGTIGARVVDASGAVYVLSNNHVLAASNAASIGDATLQPGTFDGGTSADRIGSLSAFRPIDFSGASNLFDAAIAVSDVTSLDNSTPADDGYGLPNSVIFNDADGNGLFDDRAALLGVAVQKYGRTTKLTRGTITGVNATVDICYEVVFIFCTKSARFTDQMVIASPGFSDGGDSGSLIVTDDTGRNPVGLLFAGSATETIANRIDFVLDHFNVAIDGVGSGPPPPPPPPPDPVGDAAMVGINAASNITKGATPFVGAVVRNGGNTALGPFNVTLADVTDGITIGTANVAGLAVGATESVVFQWNTANSSVGAHTLVASHDLIDDNAANNTVQRTVQLNASTPPAATVHIGDLDGSASAGSFGWTARVTVVVHDASHVAINGATVVGTWTPSGLNSNTCTTGELGGVGSCLMLYPGLRNNRAFATFTVNSVTMSGRTYQSTANHDPDGSSNGTTQRVNRP